MHRATRIATTIMLTGILASPSLAVAPSVALAATNSEIQQRLEQTASDYEEASRHAQEVQSLIDENERQIKELEARLPELRSNAASSISTLYKLQQSGGTLVDLILSSESFNQLVATLNYLNVISGKSSDAIEELVRTQSQLAQTRDMLAVEKSEADNAVRRAEEAMQSAVAAREEAQEAAHKAALAEQAQVRAALEEARSASGSSFTTESGNTATVETPEEDNGGGNVQWSDRDSFVAQWTSRIDNYLAGSPMAGHGRTFAEAAWDYGVDPRWSPAIACIESTKGEYCFLPHNAWGWGSSSWGDWDSAIRDHVSGLAAIYGYTISMDAANMYCPPTAELWYSSVLSQMNCI